MNARQIFKAAAKLEKGRWEQGELNMLQRLFFWSRSSHLSGIHSPGMAARLWPVSRFPQKLVLRVVGLVIVLVGREGFGGLFSRTLARLPRTGSPPWVPGGGPGRKPRRWPEDSVGAALSLVFQSCEKNVLHSCSQRPPLPPTACLCAFA